MDTKDGKHMYYVLLVNPEGGATETEKLFRKIIWAILIKDELFKQY